MPTAVQDQTHHINGGGNTSYKEKRPQTRVQDNLRRAYAAGIFTNLRLVDMNGLLEHPFST